MKKRLALLVSALLVFGLAIGLTGCGGNDEEAIRSQVAAEFDRIRDTSEASVRGRIGDEAFESLQNKGLDPIAIYTTLYGGLQYEIGEITIDKDVAMVPMTVTNVDAKAFVEGYKARVEEWAASEDATYTFDQYGQEGIEDEVMRMLNETLSGGELPTATREVTIELHKNEDGTWVPADGSQLEGILFGGTELGDLLA